MQFENDRKNETIKLTMNPVKGKVVYHTNCVSHNNDPKNKEAWVHRFMVLQKNFYQKKLIMGNIQRITDQKGPRK